MGGVSLRGNEGLPVNRKEKSNSFLVFKNIFRYKS